MANARILYNYDTWDAARGSGIATSSALSSAPVTNLLLDPIGKAWSPSSKTAEWVRLNLGTATRLTCVCLAGGNWTSQASIYLEANTSDYWVAPAYYEQIPIAVDADGVPYRHLVLFLDQTYRYWRVTWDDPANPADHLRLGRIIAGEHYELARNFARQARITWADPSAIEHKPGTVGNIPTTNQPAFRQVRATFPWRATVEMAKWDAIYRKVGKSRPLMLALDPVTAPTRMSLYGYMVTDLEASWETYARYDIATLVFEEKVY